VDSVFFIENILNAEEVSELLSRIDVIGFVDGKDSATGMARAVKHNQQIPAEKVPDLMPVLSRAILGNNLFNILTMPRTVSNILVSRYQPGMEYGTHTDAAIMNSGHRSDISFTLFLSEPDSYEGGDLILETPFGEQAVRLKPGSLILYPTGELHRVSPVTSGERIVIVGWVESRIRDSRKRQILLDLETARKHYLEKAGHDRVADLLLKSSMNLRRMWDE